MPTPNNPNMQNHRHHHHHHHHHVQGASCMLHVFRCPRCSSYNNICNRCLSYSHVHNFRYLCNNCRRQPWTPATGRQQYFNFGYSRRPWNRRLRRSSFSGASSSTAAPPTTSSSSSSSPAPATAAGGGNAAVPSSSIFTAAVEPTLSNLVPQASMLQPVVEIPRPALPQQPIPNIVEIPQPALPQQQNPNMGITVTEKPAVGVIPLDLRSLTPPPERRPSSTPQRQPLPFDLNMDPPDS